MTSVPARPLLTKIAASLDAVMGGAEPHFAELREEFAELKELVGDGEGPHIVQAIDSCIRRLDDLEREGSSRGPADVQLIAAAVRRLRRALDTNSLPPKAVEPLSAPASKSERRSAVLPPAVVADGELATFCRAVQDKLSELEAEIRALKRSEPGARELVRGRLESLRSEAAEHGMSQVTEVLRSAGDFIDRGKSSGTTSDLLFMVRDWLDHAFEAKLQGNEPNNPSSLIGKLQSKELEIQGSLPPPARVTVVPEVPKKLRRDEEAMAMLGDFVQESGESLSEVEQILLRVENDGASGSDIDALMRAFHTIKGVAAFLEVSDMTTLAHVTEELLKKVEGGEVELADESLDLVFDAVELMQKILTVVRAAVEQGEAIRALPEVGQLVPQLHGLLHGRKPRPSLLPEVKHGSRVGEVLVDSGVVSEQAVDAALAEQRSSGRKLGEELVATKAVKAKNVAQALRAQRNSDPSHVVRHRLRETVKVDLDHVDSLLKFIGELVIVESMVVNAPEITALTSAKIRNYLGQFGKISRELQDLSTRMRMVPVQSVFQKMGKLVRDVSRKTGKSVRLDLFGESTEMDRSMAEQIGDPLVHLIRNAVDHGLETPEERVALGKPSQGTVRLSAYHEAGTLVIEVSDDGRGLNREAILDKAVERGLIREGQQLADADIYGLIFGAGFSTAREVTETSGRGVGMDVVRRNIEAMRGRVTVSSVAGQGTTFKMMLPLTLAIIDGMLIACGNERYIIPTLTIVESIQPDAEMLGVMGGRADLLNLRDEVLPLVRLDRLFGIEGAIGNATEALVVIVESLGTKVGLVVDRVLKQQQVVIKPLGDGLDNIRCISGAAILPDGKVGLILNVDEIGLLAEERSRVAGLPPAAMSAPEKTAEAAATLSDG